jgi:ABC-type uncharacterized transport system permease subunit
MRSGWHVLLAGGGFGALLALLRLIGFTGEPPSTATAAAVTALVAGVAFGGLMALHVAWLRRRL